MDADEALNHFIAGFVSGEGSFFITAHRTISRRKPSLQVVCGFSLKLRDDDRELVEIIREALGLNCAIHEIKSDHYHYTYDEHIKRKDAVMLIVRRLSDLTEHVLPFFDRYSLRGCKRKNYELWRRAVIMVEHREHLTLAGMDEILGIKAQLNRY